MLILATASVADADRTFGTTISPPDASSAAGSATPTIPSSRCDSDAPDGPGIPFSSSALKYRTGTPSRSASNPIAASSRFSSAVAMQCTEFGDKSERRERSVQQFLHLF